MIRKEPLNGGLVQTRHPTLLRPGELQQADDTILRPGDPAIWKAPGRTAYGTVASTSISCTTNGTTTLTSSAAFGTAVASCTTVLDSPFVTTSGDFSTVPVVAGQTIVGTGIPVGTFVQRVHSTTKIELTQSANAAGTVTLYFCDIHPGTYITGTGITAGTTISSIASDSSLTMSAIATDSTTTTRTFSERVQGLRHLIFDGGANDVLVAKAADQLYTSDLTTTTGTFSSLLTGLSHSSDAILDAIQVKNKHVLLTGVDTPRVIYYADDGGNPSSETLAARSLGMLPVTDFIGPTIRTGDGAWSSILQEGWYYFIVTEVAIFGEDDEIEGTWAGEEPKGVHITDYTTQAIDVDYKPSTATAVNDGNYGHNTATHWRLYMSKGQANQFPLPDYATFTRVATVDIATTTVKLRGTNAFQSGYADVLATIAGYDALFPETGNTNALAGQAAPASPITSVYTKDDTAVQSSLAFGDVKPGMTVTSADDDIPYGTTVKTVFDSSNIILTDAPTASSGAAGKSLYFGNQPSFDGAYAVLPPNGTNSRKRQFQNFGIQNQGTFSSSTITGVKVEIRVRGILTSAFPKFRPLIVSLETGGVAGTEGAEYLIQPTVRWQNLALGGPNEKWGLTLTPSSFEDGTTTFGVNIRNSSTTGVDYHIDGVKITVYAGGADNLNTDGEPFRTVTISDQLGTSFSSGANGPPPVATTGDIFQGQLLLNDVDDESSIVGSLPDEENAFPDVYRLPFESRQNDKVKVIRRLNNACIIGCQDSIKRLNYFPTENDAEFAQGKAYEDIASDHGMVGPRATALFEIPGQGLALAYLSHNGLHITDGATTRFLNEDIDWENLIAPAYIHQSVLEAYPKLSILALYYVPKGGTRKTKALYFSYHPIHVKEGFRLPATGPVTVAGESAAYAIVSGTPYFFTGHSLDGVVYLEDQWTTASITSADGSNITPTIRTRRFWTADIGMQGRVERTLLLTDAAGTSTTGGLSVQMYRQNQNEAVTANGSALTNNTATGGVLELWSDMSVEAFDIAVSKSSSQTSALRLHYLGYEVTPGGQDSN